MENEDAVDPPRCAAPTPGVAPSSRRPRLPWLLALGIALLYVPLSLPAYTGNDEGMWLYMGRIWADHGMPPYRAAVENKTPGIFLLFTLSNLAFGTSPIPPRIAGLLAIAFGSVAAGSLARRLGGASAAPIAQVVYGLVMGWHLLDGRYTAQTETFMALFSLLSLDLLLRALARPPGRRSRLLLASALLVGVAIAFKQVAVFSACGWLAAYAVNARERPRSRALLRGVALLASGIAAATLLSLVPLLLSGVTPADYADGAWRILIGESSGRAFPSATGGLVSALVGGLSERRPGFLRTWTDSRLALFAPLLLLLAVRFRLAARRPFLGLLLWGACDFAGANASGFYMGHQLKQVVPTLAVMTGVLLADLLGLLGLLGGRARLAQVAAVALVAVLTFPGEEMERGRAQWRRDFWDSERELGRWIDHNAPPGASVLVADRSLCGVLAYSGRTAPGRYFNALFLGRPGALEETLRDLRDRPPHWIVKRYPWDSVPDALRARIEEAYDLVGDYRGIALYRKRP